MTTHTESKKVWDQYCEDELMRIRPILQKHGFTLSEVQPHLAGERYLMHAVTTTSGKKLILLGVDAQGENVVIKATRDTAGIRELIHERICKDVLKKIDFAGEVFHTPEERAFIQSDGYTITIQRSIPQESSFLDRPIEAQFALALTAFKGQESAHATTFNHRARIGEVFGMRDAHTYLDTFATFESNIRTARPKEHVILALLQKARALLTEHTTVIEQYSGFLTHTDFVPHNIRIQGNTIYLLDHSSLTFGNKYEGWARFINFMTLYNPPLQRALEDYVRNNRTPEESVALRMMRIYRLGEIIWYYVRSLDTSTGNLLTLNTARVHFWSDILIAVLDEKEASPDIIERYKKLRDELRSEDEKQRQQGLH
jgi:hypothetical protein